MVPARSAYVPILRTKPAEWDALSQLPLDVRRMLVPCLEVLPAELNLVGDAGAEGLRHATNELAKKIGRTWGRAPSSWTFRISVHRFGRTLASP